MGRQQYIRGADYPFNFFIEDTDCQPVDMGNVNEVLVYLYVNKREVGRWTKNAKEGYELLLAGDVSHEFVIPVKGVVTENWPSGLLEAKILTVHDEEYFDPEGMNEPVVFEIGFLN